MALSKHKFLISISRPIFGRCILQSLQQWRVLHIIILHRLQRAIRLDGTNLDLVHQALLPDHLMGIPEYHQQTQDHAQDATDLAHKLKDRH